MGLQYRKSKIKLNYLESKPDRYKIQQLTYPAVSFGQLVHRRVPLCYV